LPADFLAGFLVALPPGLGLGLLLRRLGRGVAALGRRRDQQIEQAFPCLFLSLGRTAA